MVGESGKLYARATKFFALIAQEMGVKSLEALPRVSDKPPVEANRIIINDPAKLTIGEVNALGEGYRSRFGAVAFDCQRVVVEGDHPLIQIGAHLSDVLPTRWPVISTPIDPDGTTKIRDLGKAKISSRSLTNQAMAAHQDGWLSLPEDQRGALGVTALWAETVPVECAATFSQNIVFLSLELWREDEEAFMSLFSNQAVKIVDSFGKIAAQSPVLTVKKGGCSAFFRGRNDEYDVLPGTFGKANARAIEFLNSFTSFGSNGTMYTYLDRCGRGLLINNRYCVHGRTAFRDGTEGHEKRIIASKWWASHESYRDLVW